MGSENEEKQASHKAKTKKGPARHTVTTIILVLIFLTGLSLMLYPSFSNWWNQRHQSRAIASYVAKTNDMSQEERQKLWDAAAAYNEKLSKEGLNLMLSDQELEEYNSVLDVTGTGIMGYVDIPKINVSLPIYHGTDESVLQIAIGHIAGSSLPVGGAGSHCVISGHRGLPSARLFTDIDQLQEGDRFMLQVLGETLTYEVDQIRTVLPDELDDLQRQNGQDYCTLVTCTPYGVNTHRLLVRGHRVPNTEGDVRVNADAIQINPMEEALIIGAVLMFLILLWSLISTRNRGRHRHIVKP